MHEGSGTLLASDLTVLASFSVPLQALDMALSSDRSELAVTAADGITFYFWTMRYSDVRFDERLQCSLSEALIRPSKIV